MEGFDDAWEVDVEGRVEAYDDALVLMGDVR